MSRPMHSDVRLSALEASNMAKLDTVALPTAYQLLIDGLADVGKVEKLGIQRKNGIDYEVFKFELLNKSGQHMVWVKTWLPVHPEPESASLDDLPNPNATVAILEWLDLDENVIETFSGLSLKFSDFVAGATLTDSSARYDFLVSLRDGNLKVNGSSGSDLALEVGEGGTARVFGKAGFDKLHVWHQKNVVFDGGADSDTLLFQPFTGFHTLTPTPTQQLIVNLATGVGQNPFGGTLALKNVENVVGTAEADRITGNNAANVIGDGAFDIGADTVKGLGGDDVIKRGSFAVGGSYDGGDGFDELSFALDMPTLDPVRSVLDLRDASRNTGVFEGGKYVNLEKFTAANFSSGEHTLDFRGSNGAEEVRAGAHDDRLQGRGGADTLNGGSGDDTIAGGAGKDSLSGGLDGDAFDFNSFAESGATAATRDVIADFDTGTGRSAVDRIDLKTLDADLTTPGNQRFAFIGSDAFGANSPGEVRVARQGGSTIVFLNNDNDAAAEMQIELTGLLTLRANDLLL